MSQKSIPDIFDCNLKTNYQILIIFNKNIPDTIGFQVSRKCRACFFGTRCISAIFSVNSIAYRPNIYSWWTYQNSKSDIPYQLRQYI